MKCIPLLKTAAAVTCAACVASAGAGAQTTNGTATAGPAETLGQHLDDATITTKVKAELLGAKDLKSQRIHVKTRHGVVSLTGSVPTAEERDSADQVAQNVTGVQSVKNHLKVTPAQ